jgi:hypothetical protein
MSYIVCDNLSQEFRKLQVSEVGLQINFDVEVQRLRWVVTNCHRAKLASVDLSATEQESLSSRCGGTFLMLSN